MTRSGSTLTSARMHATYGIGSALCQRSDQSLFGALERRSSRRAVGESLTALATALICWVRPHCAVGHVRTFDLDELAPIGHNASLPFVAYEHYRGWLVIDL